MPLHPFIAEQARLAEEKTLSLRERWVRYCLKMECVICTEAIFPHREDAEAAVDAVLADVDYGVDPPISCLRDGLSWFEHKGEYCDYHSHVMGKDD